MRCTKCLRWLAFLINLVFWLFGFVFLAIGLWLRFDPEVAGYVHMSGDTLSEYYTSSYFMIAVGLLMVLVGFCGCCGAFYRSTKLLAVFFVVILTVVCLQLGCATLAYFFKNRVDRRVKIGWRDSVPAKYTEDEYIRDTVDHAQEKYRCCGSLSKSDYINTANSAMPSSCCNINSPHFAKCRENLNVPVEEAFYDEGCVPHVVNLLQYNLNLVITFCVVFCLLQLFGVLVSMWLCVLFTHEENKDYQNSIYHK